jgi:broad specificity phosphatase PhoE
LTPIFYSIVEALNVVLLGAIQPERVYAKEVTLLLIRHGETDWNAEKRAQGHSDIPLNEKGIAQAKMTAEKLFQEHSDIIAIYSSDLSRARDTAQATADKFKLPIILQQALRELNAGSTEGMKLIEKAAMYRDQWNELKRKYPLRQDLFNHTPVPGEETLNALMERMKKAMISIAESAPDKGKVAIFSHGKAIRTVIAGIEDCELDEITIPNCCVIEVSYDSENTHKPFFVNL